MHGYFHDTDLLETRRRLALVASLAVLGRRRRPCDLDSLAAAVRENVSTVSFDRIARGRAADRPE